MNQVVSLLAAVALVVMLGACATPPAGLDAEARAEFYAENDPLEPTNRAVFAFNRALDEALFQPLARTYRELVPAWIRTGIGNAIDNLKSPVVFMNDVLQGEPKRAATTVLRFGFNTTFGVAGINDFAKEIGLEAHDEDFGQTLAVWGSEPGPYLMLPLLGPSNPRDAVGRVVDFLVDPFNIWAANTGREELTYARSGVTALHLRSDLLDLTDDLEKTSLDLYAAVRSLYRQRRAHAISNGAASPGDTTGAADFPDWPAGGNAGEISGRP